MGTYLDTERPRQLAWWERHATDRGLEPRHEGKHAFVLPSHRASEHLYPATAAAVGSYFQRHRITWHRARGHLCSSQVACLNFLFPLGRHPEALADLLNAVRDEEDQPRIARVLEIDPGSESPFIAFEFIGPEDYLGERRGRTMRTRGANCTSADAAMIVETVEGRRELLLIEWKFTESYAGTPLQFSGSGTDRCAIYEPARKRYPVVASDGGPEFESYFYEPSYQLLRQQLLAAALEHHRALGVDTARVLHISPRANRELHDVTSPALRQLGDDVFAIWKRVLARPDRFTAVHAGAAFAPDWADRHPRLESWWAYVSERYASALTMNSHSRFP